MQFQVDDLIGVEHPARLIWNLAGKMDLSDFEKEIASRKGGSGRSCWEPRLLISLWIYGYTRGVASARQLERMSETEPGIRWLCGMETVNHHTLSDFRVQAAERLEQLLTNVLAALAQEGLVNFGVLLQDGTKIKTQASRHSFHRSATLQRHRDEARAYVEELDRRAAAGQDGDAGSGNRTKKEAAMERAARERLARSQAAIDELQQRQAEAKPGERNDVRVSESECEARKMKQTNGGFDPSYNVQFVTEAKSGFVVAVSVGNESNDQHQLVDTIALAQTATGQAPQTVIADGGYASRENVEAMTAQQVELVAPWKSDESRAAGALACNGIAPEFAPSKFAVSEDGGSLRCPAGQTLIQIATGTHHGQKVLRYEADRSVCGACVYKPLCCPKRQARRVERTVESEAMTQYRQRMAQPETQQMYKMRSRIAEYVHMKLKGSWGVTRFRVKGLAKAGKEALWMAIAFNVQVMLTLRRQQGELSLMAG
jgi:transposase